MIEIDTSDLVELERDLTITARRTSERAARVVRDAGDGTVNAAKRIVPVDTGLLRSTIGVDYRQDGLAFEAGPTTDYAPFVEYGTIRMSPQPYMGPAFQGQIPTAVAKLTDVAGRLW